MGLGYGAGSNSCDKIVSNGNPYPCCKNTISNYGEGNCTWYAAYRANAKWGDNAFYNLGSLGNARSWGDNIKAKQNIKNAQSFIKKLRVSNTPKVNSIAVKTTGNYGHVAWVTKVLSNGRIIVDEQNCIRNKNVLLDENVNEYVKNMSNSTRKGINYSATYFQQYIYFQEGDAPRIFNMSGSINSIEVGQPIKLKLKAEDRNHDLKEIDIDWNDGSSVQGYSVKSGEVITIKKTFNKKGTIKWSATAYDKKGNNSEMIQGQFEVVIPKNHPPQVKDVSIDATQTGFNGSFHLIDKDQDLVSNLKATVTKANSKYTCSEYIDGKYSKQASGYKKLSVCKSFLNTHGSGDYIISITGQDDKGASILKNSYTLRYDGYTPPPKPKSCFYKGTTYKDGQFYKEKDKTQSCPSGYKGFYFIENTCKNGEWKKQTVNTCQSVKKPDPVICTHNGGKYSIGKSYKDDKSCPKGQEGLVSTTYTCSKNGQWKQSKKENNCKPVKKTDPVVCTHKGDKYSIGKGYKDHSWNSCPKGQEGLVSTTYTCGKNGQWKQSKENNCKPVKKPDPVSCTHNGDKYFIGQSYEDYDSCPRDEEGSITTTYTCGKNGQWKQSKKENNCTKPQPTKPILEGGVHIRKLSNGFKLNSRTAKGDVEFYKLYRSTQSGNRGYQIKRSSNNRFEDYDIEKGVTYYYTIAACNSAGCDYSSQDYGTIEKPQPTKPILNGGVNIRKLSNGFKLNSRTAKGDVEFYKLYRSTQSGNRGYQIKRSSNNRFEDYDIEKGVTYYYTIAACNSAGCDYSSQDYGTIK